MELLSLQVMTQLKKITDSKLSSRSTWRTRRGKAMKEALRHIKEHRRNESFPHLFIYSLANAFLMPHGRSTSNTCTL